MKNLILFLLFGLFAVNAHSHDLNIVSLDGDEEIPHSELMLRMIAHDPDMTIRDYAELYCEYLQSEGYALGANSREDFIEKMTGEQDFADVVALINRYDYDYFRENIAMDILHWTYGGGGDPEEAEGHLNRLVNLCRIVEQDTETLLDPQFNEALGEVMGYFMELFFNMLGNSMDEIFNSFTFDFEDGDIVFDIDELTDGEIIEVL